MQDFSHFRYHQVTSMGYGKVARLQSLEIDEKEEAERPQPPRETSERLHDGDPERTGAVASP